MDNACTSRPTALLVLAMARMHSGRPRCGSRSWREAYCSEARSRANDTVER